MNNADALVYEFKKEWDRVGVYHAKGLIKDVPNWEEILNILNAAIRDNNSRIKLETKNDFEIIYKDLFAIKKLVYLENNDISQTVESDATFFFSLFFNQETFGSVISESVKNQTLELDKLLNIESDFNSLKISLSDKFVPYESHTWHTWIIQLQGINHWYLRDKKIDLDETYLLEPGDCLFFKEGVEHQLFNEKPRSSVVGRFTMVENNE